MFFQLNHEVVSALVNCGVPAVSVSVSTFIINKLSNLLVNINGYLHKLFAISCALFSAMWYMDNEWGSFGDGWNRNSTSVD